MTFQGFVTGAPAGATTTVTLRVIPPVYTHPPARGRREGARAAGVDNEARWTPYPPKSYEGGTCPSTDACFGALLDVARARVAAERRALLERVDAMGLVVAS